MCTSHNDVCNGSNSTVTVTRKCQVVKNNAMHILNGQKYKCHYKSKHMKSVQYTTIDKLYSHITQFCLTFLIVFFCSLNLVQHHDHTMHMTTGHSPHLILTGLWVFHYCPHNQYLSYSFVTLTLSPNES